MSRSQAQIVGYVALAAAITGIVVGVYFWGTPMVQKNSVASTISNVENGLVQLAQTIQDAGLKEVSRSYTFNYNGQIEVSGGKITYTVQVPVSLYTTKLPFIPINYNYVYECSKNTTVYKGQTVYLCGNDQLIATISGNQLKIEDKFYNRTISLPANGYYSDVIAQIYVFDIKCDGSKCQFLWKGNIGYKGFKSAPAYTIDAVTTHTGKGEVITYILKYRPVLDPQTHKCVWIKIVPVGTSSVAGSGTVTFSINFDKSSVIPYSDKSTVCDYLETKTVEISLS